MGNPNVVTTFELVRCRRILESAGNFLKAVELAAKLDIGGKRETQRRRVRAIIKRLREDGAKVVANLSDGYFLTVDAETWREYLEGRQIDAKRILAETHSRQKVAASAGQGMLFPAARA